MAIREQVLSGMLHAAGFTHTPEPPLTPGGIEQYFAVARDQWVRASSNGWWIDVWGRHPSGLHETVKLGLSKRPNQEKLVPERIFSTEEALVRHLGTVLRELDDLADGNKVACPACGARLVVREQKHGPNPGSTFLGCVNWKPRSAGCDGRRSVPARQIF